MMPKIKEDRFQDGYEEGHSDGYEEGYEAAEKEYAELIGVYENALRAVLEESKTALYGEGELDES